MPGEAKYSPRRLAALKRAEQALELRIGGRRWREIAAALGYRSHNAALMAVSSLLQKTAQVSTKHYRALTLERLTKVIQVFWPKMLNGDYKAAGVCLRAIADVRSLLGLDAPVKLEVDIHEEARRIASELGLDPDAVIQEAERILKRWK